jgi:hypothetical protein
VSAGLNSTSAETLSVTIATGLSHTSATLPQQLTLGYAFWSLNERAGAGTSVTFAANNSNCEVAAVLMI